MNSYYNPSGFPGDFAPGASSDMRSELARIGAGFDTLESGLKLSNQNQGTIATAPNSSVGLGSVYVFGKRTAGVGQYGNALFESLVSAAIPSGQLDVSLTGWVTATNLAGATAAVFGGWTGANTPYTGQTYTGGSAVGHEVNVGNRWADFGLQPDVGGTRYTVGLQVVPDVVPSVDTQSSAVTMTAGTPGVVNWTSHNLTANTPLYFGGAGTLPAALTAGTTYYVMAAGLAANAFQVSATLGGAAVNFAGPSAGALNAVASFPGSFGVMLGPSVHDHRWWVGNLIRYDTLMAGGFAHQIAGAANAGFNVPAAVAKLLGYWVNGIDFSGASFSGAPLKFGAGQVSGTATAGGGIAAPATVAGFIIVDSGGSLKRVPYYNP